MEIVAGAVRKGNGSATVNVHFALAAYLYGGFLGIVLECRVITRGF